MVEKTEKKVPKAGAPAEKKVKKAEKKPAEKVEKKTDEAKPKKVVRSKRPFSR